MRAFTRVLRVDEEGIGLRGVGDEVLDVLFDDRRIWSFWSGRDTDPGPGPGRRHAAWPRSLQRFLDGTTRVTVRVHVTERVLHDAECSFGSGAGRVAVEAPDGTPLGLDKSGRASATFDVRSAADVAPLLDAIETVLEALRTAGVQPFVAYGTLLGAVREGGFLGHDSDADLGYVSEHEHPVDVVRESFRLQRAVAGMGFATLRYSGAAFRVDVAEADGNARGLDVFAGFVDHDWLHLMGEVSAPFRREWIYPTTTARLEDRDVPVPAVPERLLEATYGPHWRVPDPAFKFSTPDSARRRLTGWFRGNAFERLVFERAFGRLTTMPGRTPSPVVEEVLDWVGPNGRVLDVGAGRGVESVWLGRQGVAVSAYDFVPKGLRVARRIVEEERLPVEVRTLNLTEWRSVFGEGARAARFTEERRVVLARHVADSTNRFGRESLARFCAMALRGGGRLHLDVWTGEGAGPKRQRPVRLAEMVGLVENQGARVVLAEEVGVDEERGRNYSIGRLVAEWD